MLELEAPGFLNQEADPGVTTIVDARNGLNELSRLAMLQTVRHRCLQGRGSCSIYISIGRSFSYAGRGDHCSP